MQYSIGHGQEHFVAGTIDGGRQVLIWHDVTNIYLLFFEGDGRFAGHEVVHLLRPAGLGPGGFCRSDPSFDEGVEHQFEEIHHRLNLTESDIVIQSFSDDELSSGIDPMPLEYKEFLNNPTQFDSETQESLSEDSREWIESGRFVLNLGGHEYWLSKAGEVLSHS